MKKIAIIVTLMLCWASSFAQYRSGSKKQSNGSIMDKIYFAGGGGLGSGTGINGRYNYFSLLPTIGYRPVHELIIGVNITYSKYSYPDLGVSYTQFGYGPFVRYYLQQLFFQAEYDRISSTTINNETRKYYDRLLVGVGYSQPLGARGAINAMGMYDLLYQQNGVFQSPFVFRVFFSY